MRSENRIGLLCRLPGRLLDSTVSTRERSLSGSSKGVASLAPPARAMAASSGDDVPTQLAALLGREIFRIRKTDETPPRISAVDVVQAITGKTKNNAGNSLDCVKERYPEVSRNLRNFRFPGRGQRDTPVVDVRGIVEIVMLLPGRHAARVRRQAAELLCRYLGGDLALVDEVCRNRGFQEQLAVQAPEDPRRLFGEVVEATGGTVGSATTIQLARACTEAIANAVPGIIERLSAHIDERMAQDRQRVNLNVRAPKRDAPHQPQIARSLAGVGRPFPVAKFLDLKEREDPSWKCARRSFAPAFSMQVQVLKKKKLKEESRAAVYIEQNHRPQLLYTEEDREIMEAAWELTTAHREDLAGRPGNPQAAPMLQGRQDRQNVMDMLLRR